MNSLDPQQATEHDYPHDDEDCSVCGGSEQIEVVFQDHHRDYVACPVCLSREKAEAIVAKDGEIGRLRAERDELQKLFAMQWDADQRAIKRWQEAHPGNELVWPDRADMVVWLMEQHVADQQGRDAGK